MTMGEETRESVGRPGDSSARGDVGGAAKQEAQAVAEHVRSQAKAARRKAKARASSTFDEQKGRMAREVSGLARALHKTADQLEGEDQENLAVYLRSAANVTNKVGESIEGKDARELMGSADDLARREPVLLFVGAAALGFLASRAIRAGREDAEIEPREAFEPSSSEVVEQGI
jgi:hypothetical protein